MHLEIMATQAKQDQTMKEIEALSQRVEDDEDVDGVRIDIANLMVRLLNERRDTLTYWDKACFAQAVWALNWNLDQQCIASTAWLQLSLVCLKNVFVQKAERSERQHDPKPTIDALTFDQIEAEIRKIGSAI